MKKHIYLINNRYAIEPFVFLDWEEAQQAILEEMRNHLYEKSNFKKPPNSFQIIGTFDGKGNHPIKYECAYEILKETNTHYKVLFILKGLGDTYSTIEILSKRFNGKLEKSFVSYQKPIKCNGCDEETKKVFCFLDSVPGGMVEYGLCEKCNAEQVVSTMIDFENLSLVEKE